MNGDGFIIPTTEFEVDMNQNEMDRYFWRTGQRWSGDSRPIKAAQSWRLKLGSRTILVLFVAYIITFALPIIFRPR